MCDFTALDLVECIDNRADRPESAIMPQMGRLYTVDSVRAVGDGHSVRLIELEPACHMGGACGCGDCGWDARRFRKICRPKRSIDALIARIKMPAPAAA